MADISYLEGWGMWLDGRSTLGNDLFGVPMVWWGRGGKIATFAGGLTVVLDLIGAERLRAAGQAMRLRRQRVRRRSLFGSEDLFNAIRGLIMLGAFVALLFGHRIKGSWAHAISFLGAAVVCVVVYPLVFMAVQAGMAAIAATLDRPMPAHWIRVAAVATVVLGFHFDLLAS
ncbi:hypothetical protein ACIHFD_63100 [Nonomuraea sp. NPDC051941]|uniref:hypothetical protein n=1 Tax=Nonomuraea sp. NPDC051941 TaxID=3364373 RepID=UPI0037C6E5E6